MKCSIASCDLPTLTRGWCEKHYRRFLKHGSPDDRPLRERRFRDPEEAFAARTEQRGACLQWIGSLDNKGYGSLVRNGKSMKAHRYAWERANGPIPEGMVIDHLCFNRGCVNADHLRLATHTQNRRSMSGPSSRSTTGVLGVYRNNNGYIAKVGMDGKEISFGTYPTIEEAAAAVRRGRAELFGEFAGAIVRGGGHITNWGNRTFETPALIDHDDGKENDGRAAD